MALQDMLTVITSAVGNTLGLTKRREQANLTVDSYHGFRTRSFVGGNFGSIGWLNDDKGRPIIGRPVSPDASVSLYADPHTTRLLKVDATLNGSSTANGTSSQVASEGRHSGRHALQNSLV